MGNLKFAEQFVREEIITGTIIGHATSGLYESNAEIERILTKVYEQLEAWVDSRVESIINTLTRANQEGESPVSRLHELQRLQALKEDMTKQFAKTFENADAITREMQKKVGDLGIKQADDLIIKELKDARVPASIRPRIGGFPKERIDKMVGLTTNNTRFNATSFGLPGDEFEKMRENLIRGTMLGENPNKIADRIHKQIGVAKERAITTSRTAIMYTHRTARLDRFREHSDVVDKWIWSSAADDRTCAACWAMHGTEHDLDEEMVGHPRCRCVPVPKTKSWEDLGIYGVDDTVKPFEKGEAKFRKLSRDKQRKILGDTGWYHWSQGNIKFKDFAGYTQHPTYGKMVVKRSLRSMGIDASYKGRQAIFGTIPVTLPPGAIGSSLSPDARIADLKQKIKWAEQELKEFRDSIPALKEELKEGFIDQAEYEDQLTETLEHVAKLESDLYAQNKQLESLISAVDKDNRTNTVDTRPDAIDAAITELRTKLANLEQRAAAGEISPNTLKTQRYKLNKQIKELEAKRVIKPPKPDTVTPPPPITPPKPVVDPVTNLTPDQKKLKELQDELAAIKAKMDALHERAFRGEIKPNTLKTQEYKLKKEITRINNEISLVNNRIAGGSTPPVKTAMTITEVTPPTVTGDSEISILAKELRDKGEKATVQEYIALGKSIREASGSERSGRMSSEDFKALKAELAKHREFGYDKEQFDFFVESGALTFDDPRLETAFRNSLEKMPKEWSDRLFRRAMEEENFAFNGLSVKVEDGIDRGYFQSRSTSIYIPRSTLDSFERAVEKSKKTLGAPKDPYAGSSFQELMDHEVTHFLEYANPGMVRAEKSFYASRTLGDKAQHLGPGYEKDEFYKKDKWSQKYMGKEYAASMEIMSMANDSFFKEGGFVNDYNNNDQEFIDWHLGMLAGNAGSGSAFDFGKTHVAAPVNMAQQASVPSVSPEMQKLLDKEMLLAEKLANGQIVQATYKTQMYKIKKQKEALANVQPVTTLPKTAQDMSKEITTLVSTHTANPKQTQNLIDEAYKLGYIDEQTGFNITALLKSSGSSNIALAALKTKIDPPPTPTPLPPTPPPVTQATWADEDSAKAFMKDALDKAKTAHPDIAKHLNTKAEVTMQFLKGEITALHYEAKIADLNHAQQKTLDALNTAGISPTLPTGVTPPTPPPPKWTPPTTDESLNKADEWLAGFNSNNPPGSEEDFWAWKDELVAAGHLSEMQLEDISTTEPTYQDEIKVIKKILQKTQDADKQAKLTPAQYQTVGNDITAWNNMFAQPAIGQAEIDQYSAWKGKLVKDGFLTYEQMVNEVDTEGTYKDELAKIKQLLGSNLPTSTGTSTIAPGGGTDVAAAKKITDKLAALEDKMATGKIQPSTYKTQKYKLNKELKALTGAVTTTKPTKTTKTTTTPPTVTPPTALTPDDQLKLDYVTQAEDLLDNFKNRTMASDELETATDILVQKVLNVVPQAEYVAIDMAWNDIGDVEATLKHMRDVLKANVSVAAGGMQTTFKLVTPPGKNPGGKAKPGATKEGLKGNDKLDDEIVVKGGTGQMRQSRGEIRDEVLKDPNIVAMLDAYMRRTYKYAGSDFERSRKEIVSEHIDRISDHWNGTSGDNDPDAIRTQIAAQQEFGLDENQLWYDSYALNEAKNASSSWHGMSSQELIVLSRATLREMHNQTVRELRAKGITEVTLYRGQYRWRGLSSNDYDNKRANTTDAKDMYFNISADMQPLNSFATSIDSAAFFGDKIFQITVPIENILSIPRTGPGVAHEREAVLITPNGVKGKLWFHEGVRYLNNSGGAL